VIYLQPTPDDLAAATAALDPGAAALIRGRPLSLSHGLFRSASPGRGRSSVTVVATSAIPVARLLVGRGSIRRLATA
jgi:hypothetical protein